tara:strand:- start:1888 stop:2526 length:639 start_codon:yes stop_codon:yes gene_type:complete
MLVLSEKVPYRIPVLLSCLAALSLLAVIGKAKEGKASAHEAILVSEIAAVEEGTDVPALFEAINRVAVVGTEITKDRSFLYAPPPNPHNDKKQGECMGCHAPETDLAKKWKSIRPIPHKVYSQCLQCHVSQVRPESELFVESDWFGLDFPGAGSRDNDYSPPTVPHKIFMRENCLSCHGDTGYYKIRTSHPERSQCLQCHAPEASVDYTRPQ